MNQDTIKGKWTEAKGAIINAWGKLTNDELDKTRGNLTEVAGIIQKKYGHAKEEVSKKLDELMGKFSDAGQDVKKNAGKAATRSSKAVKDSVKETDRH